MDILKQNRFKATSWIDNDKMVEGTLFVADKDTLQGANPERNSNGYLLFLVDDDGLQHIISPDSLQIVEREAASEIGKAVHASFMKLYKAGFTFAQVENFWKDCMSSAEIMIENKKRGIEPQSAMSGTDLIYLERARQIEVEGWTPEHDSKHKQGELANAAAYYAMTEETIDFIDEQWGNDMHLIIWPFDLKWLRIAKLQYSAT